MGDLQVSLMLCVMAVLYFLPTLVALHRDHPQGTPIAIVNVCLGWTVLGWVIALAWAASAITTRRSS